MSIAFSRSMRALKNDSFRPSMILMIFAMLFVAAWLGWFLLARLPVYESSARVRLGPGGIVQTAFSEDVSGLILPGQSALLFFGESSSDAPALRAMVTDVNDNFDSGVLVELIPLDEDLSGLEESATQITRVEIEVSRRSPALLIMDAAQKNAPTTMLDSQ
jgi:hypothetical protein